MKIRLSWAICCWLPLFILSCESPKGSPSDNTLVNSDTTTAETKLAIIKAQFVCRDITTDETMPQFEVALNLNNAMHLLDTIMSCATFKPMDFERYDIPKTAVAACGGWFAGAGDYFYAAIDENVCTVMYGWQDEQQEDDGFHYEQLRRFVVSAQ